MLDLFLAEQSDAPWIVYLHGGAWKALHKDGSSYIAESFVAAGVNLAVVNFSLVPKVRLKEQVDQAATAIGWLARHAHNYRGNTDRIYALGHSSGAHLVGMMATMEWPGNVLKGAAAFSGIFDLEPVQMSWRNQYLGMTMTEAHQLSPIRRIPRVGMPLLIGYGTKELQEFQRQSRDFAAAWRAQGTHARKSYWPI